MSSQLRVRANIQVKRSTLEIETYTTSTQIPQPFQIIKGICNHCSSPSSYSVTFVENYLKRGKYSLSEREMLWNVRMKGIINAQKH